MAIHTTEFNVCSNDDTLETEGLSIFRKRDIEQLVDELRALNYEVAEVDWSPGTWPLDYFVDLPPYKQNKHLKLLLAGYTTTSIGLIVRRRH